MNYALSRDQAYLAPTGFARVISTGEEVRNLVESIQSVFVLPPANSSMDQFVLQEEWQALTEGCDLPSISFAKFTRIMRRRRW